MYITSYKLLQKMHISNTTYFTLETTLTYNTFLPLHSNSTPIVTTLHDPIINYNNYNLTNGSKFYVSNLFVGPTDTVSQLVQIA